MRILHSCYVIQEHHGHHLEINPLRGFLLPLPSFLILVVSAILCQVSEVFLYNPADWVTWIGHLGLGGIVFIVSLLVIICNEPEVCGGPPLEDLLVAVLGLLRLRLRRPRYRRLFPPCCTRRGLSRHC